MDTRTPPFKTPQEDINAQLMRHEAQAGRLALVAFLSVLVALAVLGLAALGLKAALNIAAVIAADPWRG
jgi:hypothetical protein